MVTDLQCCEAAYAARHSCSELAASAAGTSPSTSGSTSASTSSCRSIIAARPVTLLPDCCTSGADCSCAAGRESRLGLMVPVVQPEPLV